MKFNFQSWIWILICLIALGGCSNKSESPKPAEPAPSIVPVEKQNEKPQQPSPQQPEVKNDQESQSPTSQLGQAFDNGKMVPLLVMAYSEPGNSELSVIRDIIHHSDALAEMDQDQGREREFTDFPFTVDSYLIFVKNRAQYQAVEDTISRFPKVKILIVPFQRFKVKSYAKVTYSKVLWKEPVVKKFWIGASEAIQIPEDVSTLNWEDPATYSSGMEICDEVNTTCLDSLVQRGFFKHYTIIDEDGNPDADRRLLSPLQFMANELSDSMELMGNGFNGDEFSLNKSIIKNITLVHELWTTGTAIPNSPPEVLTKVEGSDRHHVVDFNKVDGNYLYMLPVSVSETTIPLRIRNTPSKMVSLFGQLKNMFTNALQVSP